MSDCERLVPARHRQVRRQAFEAILKDVSGGEWIVGSNIPLRFRAQIQEAFESFSWPGCSKESIGIVMHMFGRMIKYQERRSRLSHELH